MCGEVTHNLTVRPLPVALKELQDTQTQRHTHTNTHTAQKRQLDKKKSERHSKDRGLCTAAGAHFDQNLHRIQELEIIFCLKFAKNMKMTDSRFDTTARGTG